MLRLSQKTEKRLYRLSELKNEPVEKLLENIINEYIEDDLLATAIEEGRETRPLSKDEALRLLNEDHL